mgnify:FL=1
MVVSLAHRVILCSVFDDTTCESFQLFYKPNLMGLMKQSLLVALLVLAVHCTIYDKLYDEAFKITQAMTIDQKIGQTLQVDFQALAGKNSTDQSLALKYFLGSVLIGGDGVPDANGNIVELPVQEDKIKLIYLNGT